MYGGFNIMLVKTGGTGISCKWQLATKKFQTGFVVAKGGVLFVLQPSTY